MNYAHEFGRRLRLSLSAGPLLNEVAQPQGGNVKTAFWSTNDSLSYSARFADLGASFSRYTNPGSGLLPGAESDWLNLNAGRRVIGKLRGSIQGGHAYNKGIRGIVGTTSGGAQSVAYETWQGGATLSHEYGKHASLYVNYQFQYQIAANPVCFLGGCRTYYELNMLGAGINWHGSPLRLR